MVSTEPRLIGVAGFEFKIFVRVFRVLLQDRYKPHAASTLCHISTGAITDSFTKESYASPVDQILLCSARRHRYS